MCQTVPRQSIYGVQFLSLFAVSTFLLSATSLRAADSIKLNGPLVAGGVVSSDGLQFSPDSSRVLYYADQDTDNVFEIYSVLSAGGTPVKLNAPLPINGDVSSSGLQFSPDSTRVLYHADQDTNNDSEIYSVLSAGGTPVKLNGPLVAGGDVDSLGLQFSPDSSRVLYLADQDTDNVNEIFSVPAGGGTPTKLNGSLVAGGNVFSSGLQFSPDSSRVLYYADQDTDTVNEIYSVPSAGGAATKLNGPLVAGGNVDSLGLQFSPDSSRVLYLADQDTDTVNEIYSVLAGGGTPTKLNGSLVAGGNVLSSGLQFSPDSSRVLYLADQDTDGFNEIYSVPAGGGTPVKLNGPLPISGDVSSLGLQFSPDSTRVLYHADQDTNNDYELYIVPAGGGTPIKLNGPLVAGGDVSTDNLQFSPDGSRVLYLADQDTDNVNEIYSVRYYGGPPTKLNSPLVAGGDVVFQQFSPDSSRVLYLADQDTDDVFEIYIVPASGGTPIKLNDPLVAGGNVLSTGLQFSPDGSRVLYLADQDTDGVNEAYVRIVGNRANAGGGGWDTAASWDQAVTPDELMQVFIDTPSTVTATGSATPRIVNELAVGGGTGTSTLALEAGAVITATHGVSIHDGGVLRGDGRVESKLTILSGGEIRSGGGDHLQIGGATHSNSGRIEAIGTSTAPAEIEFDGAVTNEEAAGEIFARNALLRFDGGLENQASLFLSFGTSDVFGDVYNVDTGTIIVSGNSNVTFYDEVVNDGELRTSAGTAAVFFGDVSGPGTYTGTGTVFFEGMFSPGSSPAAVSFSGDVVLGSEAVLAIELGGTTPGTYDQMLVSGDLVLDGLLDVSILPGFTPGAGQSFNILDWGTLDGEFFDVNLPTLAGLSWDTSQLYATGVLSLAAAGLLGDYNNNGTIDAADYTAWRDALTAGATSLTNDPTPGTVDESDFDYWRDHFGDGRSRRRWGDDLDLAK